MVQKPAVFISSTGDLRSARDLVGKVLHSMGYEPVWQDIEPTDGGDLLEVLRKWMDPCPLMIQLVGRRYGAEPPAGMAPPEFGRVSFTQFEALHFEKELGRKVIYCFLDPAFPTDPASPEPPELTALQAAYRSRIEQSNRLHQAAIAGPQALELTVRRISGELAQLRRQSEERYRRMTLLAAAAVAGIAAVAALVFVVMHRQARTEKQSQAATTRVTDELAAIRAELRAAVAPKPLSPGQTQPEALPPALLDKAKVLLARGDAEDRALAQIALKRHDEADRLIQELKRQPGNPIDEAARLLTLEGDNWYQAGQFDKAIEPYEKAMALLPDSVNARNNAAIAHTSARLGDLSAHRKRAIEIAQGTLERVPARSADWAMTQNNLGIAWGNMPTGDRGENLAKAVAAFEAALTVRTRDAAPADWAGTQNNLGIAWADMPTGDRGKNLAKAVAAFEAALTVRTKEAAPADWAMTQNNLGNAWRAMPTGDRGKNLAKAVAAFEAALTVRTRDAAPAEWAGTQNNLGNAWRDMPTGDRGKNLAKAVAAFEAALTVRTKEAAPADWAMTQNNLGNAWRAMPTGDRGKNLAKAVAAFEAALTVFTRDAAPADWALTQYNLGLALADLSEQPGEDRCGRLRQAIASDKAALLVYTAEAFPREHADTAKNLGIDRKAYEAAGCAGKVAFEDIPAAK